MTRKQLNEIRQRCDAATPAPWTCTGCGDIYRLNDMSTIAANADYDDMEFIANARQDLPALLDALEAAQAQATALERAIADNEIQCETCTQRYCKDSLPDSPKCNKWQFDYDRFVGKENQ